VRYFVQRLIQLVVVFLIVTFLVMVAIQGTSKDPARLLAGALSATPAKVEQVRQQYHLDRSYPIRYYYWMKNLVTFNLGNDPNRSTTVRTLIAQRAPISLLLGVYSIFFALIIAVPVSVLAAYRRDGYFDRVTSALSFAAVSMPGVVLAVLLAYQFAVRWNWFPYAASKTWPWDGIVEHFKNMAMPTFVLGVGLAAVFIRLLRADLVNTLQSDFITMARAKGISPRRILWRHALRSSLFSLMTSVALQFAGIIGGAVVVEQIYALPGMGQLLVQSVLGGQLLIVQACAALFALAVVVVNFAVDMLYAVVDPRIRHARALG
jgi:peptide/nickel transport system permease protein